MNDPKVEARKKEFLSSNFFTRLLFKGAKLGQKREENLSKLRKAKKDEEISDKRRKIMNSDDSFVIEKVRENLEKFNANLIKPEIPIIEKLNLIKNALCQSEVKIENEIIFSLMNMIKRLTIDEKQHNIDEIIKSGLIPVLNKIIQNSNEKISFEILVIFTNIAAMSNPEYVKLLYKEGIIETLLNILSTKNPNPILKEQIFWAFENIQADSIESRNFLIQNTKLIEEIINVFKPGPMNANLLREATILMTKLCKKKPYPAFEHVFFYFKTPKRYHILCPQ